VGQFDVHLMKAVTALPKKRAEPGAWETTTQSQRLIAKHAAIAAFYGDRKAIGTALLNGRSVRQAAKATGASVGTIAVVRKQLVAAGSMP